MANVFQQQVRIVSRDKIRASTTVMEAAFFDENGNPVVVAVIPAEHVDQVTAPNGSDAGTTQTLANALKVTVNELIASLEAGGFLSSSN
jgi:rhodanese-related sulfurtransferase